MVTGGLQSSERELRRNIVGSQITATRTHAPPFEQIARKKFDVRANALPRQGPYLRERPCRRGQEKDSALHNRRNDYFSANRSGRGLIERNRNFLGVPPKAFEPVIASSLFGENVDHQVAIIGKNPAGILIAFNTYRKFAAKGELSTDLFADGLNLTRV